MIPINQNQWSIMIIQLVSLQTEVIARLYSVYIVIRLYSERYNDTHLIFPCYTFFFRFLNLSVCSEDLGSYWYFHLLYSVLVLSVLDVNEIYSKNYYSPQIDVYIYWSCVKFLLTLCTSFIAHMRNICFSHSATTYIYSIFDHYTCICCSVWDLALVSHKTYVMCMVSLLLTTIGLYY